MSVKRNKIIHKLGFIVLL